MDGEHKKISFAFSKFAKKSNVIPKPDLEVKKDLIECLEGQSIKIVGGEESKEKPPLIIPMKNPNRKLVNLEAIINSDFNVEEDAPKAPVPDEPTDGLSLDEIAARELLKDAHDGDKMADATKILTLPVADKFVATGETESTLEDYENVPVGDFGMAVLRGMGWKDGQGIGKNAQLVKTTTPTLRPKGMGLGADKVARQGADVKPAVDREGNALKCVKGAYVKIIAGHHKGHYAQITGFDDESGRLIVKTALNNLNLSLNEFLIVPVTRDDYNKNGRVLNSAKYDEYVKREAKAEPDEVISISDTENGGKPADGGTQSSDEERRRRKKSKHRRGRSSESSDEAKRRRRGARGEDGECRSKLNRDKHKHERGREKKGKGKRRDKERERSRK